MLSEGCVASKRPTAGFRIIATPNGVPLEPTGGNSSCRHSVPRSSSSLASIFNGAWTARFDGRQISSDGGGLLLRGVDRRLRLLDRLAGCFEDRRDPICCARGRERPAKTRRRAAWANWSGSSSGYARVDRRCAAAKASESWSSPFNRTRYPMWPTTFFAKRGCVRIAPGVPTPSFRFNKLTPRGSSAKTALTPSIPQKRASFAHQARG